MAPLPVTGPGTSSNGVSWIEELTANITLCSSMGTSQSPAASARSATIENAGVPWTQALFSNTATTRAGNLAHQFGSDMPQATSFPADAGIVAQGNTPKNPNEVKMIQETVTICILIVLYMITAAIFGFAAAHWHTTSGSGKKRGLFSFPVYILIGLLVIPYLAIWGVIQVLSLSVLVVIKYVFRGRAVPCVDWVFRLPPLWLPGGLFQGTPSDRQEHVLPRYRRPGQALKAGFAQQSLTGGVAASNTKALNPSYSRKTDESFIGLLNSSPRPLSRRWSVLALAKQWEVRRRLSRRDEHKRRKARRMVDCVGCCVI